MSEKTYCKNCGEEIYLYGGIGVHRNKKACPKDCDYEPTDATPKKTYRSCLNCRFSKVCFVSNGIQSNVSHKIFDSDVYPEIADVIGKHCKLFEEDLK